MLHRMVGTCLLAEQLLASQEGTSVPWSMKIRKLDKFVLSALRCLTDSILYKYEIDVSYSSSYGSQSSA
jgi:hypothetical protein